MVQLCEGLSSALVRSLVLCVSGYIGAPLSSSRCGRLLGMGMGTPADAAVTVTVEMVAGDEGWKYGACSTRHTACRCDVWVSTYIRHSTDNTQRIHSIGRIAYDTLDGEEDGKTNACIARRTV